VVWAKVADSLTAVVSFVFLVTLSLGFLPLETKTKVYYWFFISFQSEFVLAPLLCVWLLAISRSKNTSLTSRVLHFRPFYHLGRVSYSFYCLHYAVMTMYILANQSSNRIWADSRTHAHFPPFCGSLCVL